MTKSVVKTISLLIIATVQLSGCRFGNYQSPPPQTIQQDQFKTKDLYFTSVSNFTVQASLSDNTTKTNSSAPFSAIPSSLLTIFDTAVFFATQTDTTQPPAIFNWDTSSNFNGFFTELDQHGNIRHDEDPVSNQLLETTKGNVNCTTVYQISHDGTFDTSHPSSVVFPDGSQHPVLGDLDFTFTYVQLIKEVNPGDCTDDLNYLAACYTNGTGCTNLEISLSKSLFDLIVKETGVLDIADAAKLKGLAYQVKFQ